MNRLRFFAITLMVVFACVGFTACSDDDEAPANPLLGKWNMVSGTDFNSFRETEVWEFMSNGIVKMANTSGGVTEIESFKYKVEDNLVRIDYSDEEGGGYVVMTIEFASNGTLLKLRGTVYDSDGEESVYGMFTSMN